MAQITTSLYAVKLGASGTMLALIAGAQSIGVLVMSLPVGVLVDRFGPRRPFLVGTTLLAAAGAARQSQDGLVPRDAHARQVPARASAGRAHRLFIRFRRQLRLIALSFFVTLFLSSLVFGSYSARAATARELSLKTLRHELGQRRAYALNLAIIAASLLALGLGASGHSLWLGALGLGFGLGGVQIADLTRYAQIGAPSPA